MQYMGGKSRQAGWISETILRLAPPSQYPFYWEPFVGGASVLTRLAPRYQKAFGSDLNLDLILLYQALQQGWEPPTGVSEDLYRSLKYSGPSALRGFAGFAASFGGRWFEGYARNSLGTDFVGAGRRALLRDVVSWRNVRFIQCDYADACPTSQTVIYCDPPYQGTKFYSGCPAFDHGRFWQKVGEWVQVGAFVLVSEFNAPPDWGSVGMQTRLGGIRNSAGQRPLNVERLLVHTSQLAGV